MTALTSMRPAIRRSSVASSTVVSRPAAIWARVSPCAHRQSGAGVCPTVTIGGQSGIPYLDFDGETPHPPVIALDVLDKAPLDWPEPLREIYGDVWSSPADWARRVKELGADLVNLRLLSTHPDEGDSSRSRSWP